MAGVFSNLLASVQKSKQQLTDVKASDVMLYMDSVVGNFRKVISSIDKYLLKNGVDVKKRLGDAKDKSATLGRKLLKSKFGQAVAKKLTSGGITALSTVSDLKSKLTESMESNDDDANAPPQTDKPVRSIQELARDGYNKFSGKASEWMQKARERADKRKAEVEQEKASAKTKSGKKDSWLGKILGGMASLATTLIGGIGSKLMRLGGFLVPSLTKGIFKGLQMFAPKLATMVASMVSPGKLLKGAGKLALKGARWAIPALAKGLWAGASAAVGAVTAPMLAVAAGVVAVGVGAYYAYKYYRKRILLNKDTHVGKSTHYRLLAYGFNEVKEDHFKKVLSLEGSLKKFITHKDGKAQLKPLDNDVRKEIFDAFDIDIEKDVGSEKDKLFRRWFYDRFLPTYLSFVQSLHRVNAGVYFDTIDTLKPSDLFDYLSGVSLPAKVYSTDVVPTFDDTKCYVTREHVEAMRTNILNALKKDLNLGNGSTERKVDQENKAHAKTQQAAAAKAKSTSTTPPVSPPIPKPQQNTAPELPDAEGKDKGAGASGGSSSKSQTLPVAPGERMLDDGTLAGVSTKLPVSKIYGLHPDVKNQFLGMAKEYFALTGKTINVNDALRTYEEQAKLRESKGNGAAKPGSSLHEHGLAVDINSKDADALEALGLMRKYGFTRPVGGEPWHIEPSGIALDPGRAKTDAQWRDQQVAASPGNGGGGYGTEQGAIKYKRDLSLQQTIWASGKDAPVVAAKDKGPTLAQSLASGRADRGSAPPPSPYTNVSLDKPMQETAPQNLTLPKDSGANMSPADAIRQASQMVGIDESLLLSVGKLESSLRPGVSNSKSSATGLFQFTEGTWKEMLAKHGSKYGIPPDASPTHPLYNSILAAQYFKDNQKQISGWKEVGIEEDTALYLAHHYGATGANKIFKQLASNGSASMKETVSESAYRSNQAAIGDKSVSQYVSTIAQKLDTAASTRYAGDTPSVTPSNTPSIASVPKVTMAPQANRPAVSQDGGSRKSLTPIEAIANDQLTTLIKIAAILSSIDAKVTPAANPPRPQKPELMVSTPVVTPEPQVATRTPDTQSPQRTPTTVAKDTGVSLRRTSLLA